MCPETHSACNPGFVVHIQDVVRLIRSNHLDTQRGRLPRGPVACGFSLLELLIVVAISVVLAALLLPAFKTASSKGKSTVCLNQLKQFSVAAQVYAGDNAGVLVPNLQASDTNSWVAGSMKVEKQATDPTLIRQAKLFPYVGQATVFRCPADDSRATNANLRLRSYAMNSWIGGRSMEANGTGNGTGRLNFRTFVKEAEFAVRNAATVWLFADEHEATIDDGFFEVTMDDSRPFASFPAQRHQNGFGLNFVDGHAETWRMRDPESKLIGQSVGSFSAKNSDWLRLKQVTTVPQ